MSLSSAKKRAGGAAEASASPDVNSKDGTVDAHEVPATKKSKSHSAAAAKPAVHDARKPLEIAGGGGGGKHQRSIANKSKRRERDRYSYEDDALDDIFIVESILDHRTRNSVVGRGEVVFVDYSFIALSMATFTARVSGQVGGLRP